MMDQETNTNSVLVLIFGFAIGILVSSFVFISPISSILAIFVGLAILLAEKIWNKEIAKEVLFLALVIVSFGFGSLRYSIKDFHEPLIPIPTGIVISEPENKENTTSFIVRSDNGEKFLVSTDLYSPVQYGDRVEVAGEFKEPGIIEDESSGRVFNYGKYLSKDDIYYTSSFAKVRILSNGHGNTIKKVLFSIKRSFVSKIKELLPEPEASLLSGLIVSGRDAMPKDILEEFRRAGVIHIVVLSGYNITIIAEFLRRMFQSVFIWSRVRLSPHLAPLASIAGIIFFVLMTGAEATVVRASLMVLTVIVAKMIGRNYSASRALLVAGFLMLVENPKILVFDPSFQLSFLATLALIYVVPLVEKYLEKIPEKFDARTIISTTIATQLTVLPLLVYSVGDISLVSLPANILILFFVPITMLLGFIATLLAFISSIIAIPFTFFTHILLFWILFVSNFLGNLSFATVKIPNFSWLIVALLYSGLVTLVWRLRGSRERLSN